MWSECIQREGKIKKQIKDSRVLFFFFPDIYYVAHKLT